MLRSNILVPTSGKPKNVIVKESSKTCRYADVQAIHMGRTTVSNSSTHTMVEYLSYKQISSKTKGVFTECIVNRFYSSSNKECDSWKNTFQHQENESSELSITPSFKNVKPIVQETSHFTCKKSATSFLKYVLLPILCICAGASLYALIGASLRKPCEARLNVQEIQQVLVNKVFGQERAIQDIISALQIFTLATNPDPLILVISGGTGVGKSYISSLLSENFMWKDNIQFLIIPLHTHGLQVDVIHSRLSPCGINLVLLDGLTISLLPRAISFLQELSSLAYQYKLRIIILPTLNLQDNMTQNILESRMDFIDELNKRRTQVQNVFLSSSVPIDMVFLESLSREAITMCIRDAMTSKGLSYMEEHVDQVADMMFPLHTGCKGVTSKMYLLLKN